MYAPRVASNGAVGCRLARCLSAFALSSLPNVGVLSSEVFSAPPEIRTQVELSRFAAAPHARRASLALDPPSVVSSLWRREPFPGRDSGQFPHSRRLSQFLFETGDLGAGSK